MELNAKTREIKGRNTNVLRAKGEIPAVVYGHGFENQNLVIANLEFEKILAGAGESTLVDLQVGDKEPIKVLIHDVQRDPVKDTVTHVDFRQVRLDEKISAEVQLIIKGIAPAVKEQGGIMVSALNFLHIKALPQDLVHEIEVDVTGLKEIGNVLRVSDLSIPEKLEVENKPEAAVVIVEAPRVEEEEIKPEDEEAVEAAAGEEGKEGEGDSKSGDKDKKDAKPDEAAKEKEGQKKE